MPRIPSHERRVRRESSGVFELPTLKERLKYPFIPSDPAKPDQQLAMPDLVLGLMYRGVEDYPAGLNEVATPEGLCLILHMALRGSKRQEFFQQASKLHEEHGYLQDGKFVLKNRLPWSVFEKGKPLQGLKVLDYGSAEQGSLTRVLRTLGAEAYGIDVQDGPIWHSDRDNPYPFDIQGSMGPMTVLGRKRMQDPAIREHLKKVDIVYSGKLMRTVEPPQHKEALEEWFLPLMKPGALLITVPKIRERLDVRYPNQIVSQYDHENDDIRSAWESYTIARKSKTATAPDIAERE